MLLQKIINRINHISHNFKIKETHTKHRKIHAGKYRRFDEIIERYRSSGGLKHNFQSYKLFSLADMLEKEKPLSILELGTGSTTAVFAEYVRRRMDAYLTCVDESEHWLEKNKELVNVSDMGQRVEFLCAPKVFSEHLATVEINYDMKYDRSYDFVFIDGPSLRRNDTRMKGAVNGNIFDIAEREKPKVIVVDIREATVQEIIRRLGRYYDVEISDVITKKIKENYSYFSIFRLKAET